MPGFGHGPLGGESFGEWKWSRQVLFDLLPQLYHEADQQSGGTLEAFQEALRPSFDNLRRKIRTYLDLRDPLKVRTQYEETRQLQLGKQVILQGELRQRGVDGIVVTSLLAPPQFRAMTGRFTVRDIGRTLILSGSNVPENNRAVTVTALISPTDIATLPEVTPPDPGPLHWELRDTVTNPTDRVVFEIRNGDIGAVCLGWVLNDGVSDFQVVARRRFNDNTGQMLSEAVQRGTDLYIASVGPLPIGSVVESITAVFAQSDAGKPLVLSRSVLEENNGTFRIRRVLSSTQVEIDTTLTLPDPDNGALSWELRADPTFAQIELLGLAVPLGVVEQEGTDLQVVAADTVYSQIGAFSASDVGKELSIYGSDITTPGNTGPIKVASWVDLHTLKISPNLTFPEPKSGLLRWELRAATKLGDLTVVDVHAPTLLTFLARDFDIEVDTQESESRQRSFVRNVAQWTQLKGTAKGYELSGGISGFNVAVEALWRICQDYYETLPFTSTDVFEVGEVGPGRSGATGELIAGTFRPVRLYDAAAQFRASDEGNQIRIVASSFAPNQHLYTIDKFINAQTVEFRLVDVAPGGLPDYGSGGTVVLPTVEWKIVRLYTTQPMLLPRYDEVNADLLYEVTGGAFVVDRFCWEGPTVGPPPLPAFSSTGPAEILSVTSLGVGRWRIRARAWVGTPGLAFGGVIGAIVGLGTWRVVDAAGQTFYVETLPVQVLGGPWPEYEFETLYGGTPVASAVTQTLVTYICEVQSSCCYCAASKIRATIELGTIASESGIAWERVLERVVQRLLNEVTPAHVELIITFEVGLALFLSMGGFDGELYFGSLKFHSDRATFDPGDVGRRLEIRGAGYAVNSREYQIASVLSPTDVELVPPASRVVLPDPLSGKLEWQLPVGVLMEYGLEIFPELYVPITVYMDDVPADNIWPGDTVLQVLLEPDTSPPPPYVPSTFGTGTAGTSTYGG